jgi:hypothetical protein
LAGRREGRQGPEAGIREWATATVAPGEVGEVKDGLVTFVSGRRARGRLRSEPAASRENGMAKIEGEILIGRPVDEVFDYVADQSNEPQYNPHTVRAEKSPPGPWGREMSMPHPFLNARCREPLRRILARTFRPPTV